MADFPKKTYRLEIIIGVVVIGLLIVFGVGEYNKTDLIQTNDNQNVGGQSVTERDIFGTRSGTTTAATSLGGFYQTALANGTSSKALELSANTDIAILTIKTLNASSSSFYAYEVLGSNDVGCAATATSSSDVAYHGFKVSDISWFNLGIAGSVSNPTANGTGTIATLTNLNWRCLRVNANGSSTAIWAQLKEKSFQ